MANQLFPGIYGSERDLSLVSAQGRTGDIALFIGDARKGPLKKNVLISTPEQFEAVFGTPAYDGKDFTSIAAYEYLKRAGSVYFTRVRDVSADDKYTTLTFAASSQVYTSGAATSGGFVSPANPTDSSIVISAKELSNISKNIFVSISKASKSEINSEILGDKTVDFEGTSGSSSGIYKVNVYEDYKSTVTVTTSGTPNYITGASDLNKIESFLVTFNDHKSLGLETGYGTDIFAESKINSTSRYIDIRIGDTAKTNTIGNTFDSYFDITENSTEDDIKAYQLSKTSDGSSSTVLKAPKKEHVDIVLATYKNTDNYDFDLVVDTIPSIKPNFYTNLIKDRQDITAVTFGRFKETTLIGGAPSCQDDWYQTRTTLGFVGSEASTYGIVYPMWGRFYLSYLGREVYVPSNILAVCNIANTASEFNISYAPAGEKRGALPFTDMCYTANEFFKTVAQYSEDDLGTAYTESSLNMSIFRRNLGWFIWGQRTMTTDNVARRDVHVRRTLNKIKKRVKNDLKEFLFEPATDATRSRIFTKLDNYFTGLKSPADQIIIDYGVNVINNSNDIDNGIQRIKLYVKFPRTIEKIIFEINITSSGVTISELF